MSGVLCFRRPPPSGPIVSNFLGGIKRGRNVTGALYGARINDGIVTDLETPRRAILLLTCYTRVTESKYTTIYTFYNDDNGNEDDDRETLDRNRAFVICLREPKRFSQKIDLVLRHRIVAIVRPRSHRQELSRDQVDEPNEAFLPQITVKQSLLQKTAIYLKGQFF